LSQEELKSIKVTYDNPFCNFVAIYYKTTKEIIKAHRDFWSKIPVVGNDCSHSDVTITENL